MAVAAGVFAFLAVILLMQAFALGLNSLFFSDEPWAGYLIEGILFIAIAVGAGLFAKRTFQETGPPVPTEAIEEAQEIRATLLPGEEEA